MQTLFRLALSVFISLLVAFFLASCMPRAAYRTQEAAPLEPCVAQPVTIVAESCRKAITERTDAYDLHFVEFDDQGWTYPKGASVNGQEPVDKSSEQLRLVMERLNDTLKEKHVRIFVFFHGWKHNASFNDPNVIGFRDFLNEAALYEKAAQSDNRVVGIYVGWRGKSLDIDDPWLSATFWERKTAAQHVAVGSVRELTAQLRAFQRHANGTQPGAVQKYTKPTAQPVRIYMIGHSFGGLALYASVAQSLIYGFISGDDIDGRRAPVERLGDMIVLINPAFEATRYEPLDRVARNRHDYNSYQSPVFVAITSRTDEATKTLFPLGRALNSAFETELTAEEQRANRNTPGNIDAYLTHQLDMATSDPIECFGWTAKPRTPEEVATNIRLEYNNSQVFRASLIAGLWPRDADGKPMPRKFCGSMVLSPLGGPDTPYRNPDPNMPLWNISTVDAIIKGHNGINEPAFRSFLRQLFLDEYLDTDVRPAARMSAPQLPR